MDPHPEILQYDTPLAPGELRCTWGDDSVTFIRRPPRGLAVAGMIIVSCSVPLYFSFVLISIHHVRLYLGYLGMFAVGLAMLGLWLLWAWGMRAMWRRSQQPWMLTATREGIRGTNVTAIGSDDWWPREQIKAIRTDQVLSLIPFGLISRVRLRRRWRPTHTLYRGNKDEAQQIGMALKQVLQLPDA